MRTATIITALLALVVTIVVLLNWRREPGAFQVDWQLVKLPAKVVEVSTPIRTSIVRSVSAPGEIECRDEAEVASRVVGRVIELLVQEGDYVEEGQVLVRLDDEDLLEVVSGAEARVQRIGSEIERATEELAKAERDSARSSDLRARGAIAAELALDDESTVKMLTATLAMSRSDLADAEANLRRTRTELARTIITAPMAGVIGDLEVEEGEVVIAGTTNLPGTVLMTINDLSHLQVRTRVDQADIRAVRTAQPARIYLRSSDRAEPVAGRVALIAPKGTKETEVVSFETLIDVVDPTPEVRVGMTATVEIEVDRVDDALAVPVQAVAHRKLKDLPDTPLFREWAERQPRVPGDDASELRSRYLKVVFVMEGGVAKAIPIETGLSDDRFVQVIAGLGADQTVIVGPFRALDELKDGDAVVLPPATDSTDKDSAADDSTGADSTSPDSNETSEPSDSSPSTDAAPSSGNGADPVPSPTTSNAPAASAPTEAGSEGTP